MRGRFTRFLALFLVVELTGCFSVQTRSQKSSPKASEGGVAVLVYADDAARRAKKLGPEGVLAELEYKERGRWRPVFRSLSSRWAVQVPPGSYRLRFPVRLNAAGHVVNLSGKPKKFLVRPGEVVQVEAVLEHVPVALVVVGVVVVAVVVVALSQWLRDQGFPEPPLPPPELLDLGFHLTLSLVTTPGVAMVDRAAPLVTSHFPGEDAQVPSGKVRVVWVFSEPLAPTSLAPHQVRVLGERSGLLPGVVSYDAHRWWVTWESQQVVSRERLHATLASGAVEDLAGNPLEVPSSVSFWVR